MKNRLSILLVIVGLFISSCSQSVGSKQPKLQEAQLQKSTQGGTTPKAKVYKVNWSYCAAPGKISNADENGCQKNDAPLYYWLDSNVEPKGILIRRSLPLLSNDVQYEVTILARGCFPKYSSPMPLDFYSTQVIIIVDKDLTGLRDVVEDLKLEVEPLSPEEEKRFAKNYNSAAYLVSSECPNDPQEKEKLAPYLPSS
jgi:hypothetical protein